MRHLCFPAIALSVVASAAFGGPDAITYQGSLLDSIGRAVPNGTYRMQFKLYDDAIAGTDRWTETQNVKVTRGLFSAVLGESKSLHAVFMNYADLWLEVAVDLDGSGSFGPAEVYSPRQKLAGAPWASPRIEPNDVSPNTIGGHPGNEVPGAATVGATIAGGGNTRFPNVVRGDYGTVSGGYRNEATTAGATVGGGQYNRARGRYAVIPGGLANEAVGYAAVGGGLANMSTRAYATVPGGFENTASGYAATVAGGFSNTASGSEATVVGGRDNTASGSCSFAAGRGAQATHDGSFVLADSTAEDFPSVRDDALRTRFNGGATFVVNNDEWVRFYVQSDRLIDTSANDAHLTLGGAWTNGSDRNAKENFASVDKQEVLARLAELPIQTWNYKAEDPSVRRIGPTAQDFHAAFGCGSGDTTISTVDAEGVALAAIQGLHELVKEKDAEIDKLKVRLAALEARVLGEPEE